MRGFQEEEFSGDLNLRQWAKALRYVRPYTRALVLLGVATAGLAALHMVYTLLLRGLINGADGGDRGAVLWHGAGLIVSICFQTVFLWQYIQQAGHISNHVAHDIRRDVFGRLQELEFAYYDRRPVGWLIARATGDCGRISGLLSWGLMDFAWGVVLMFVMAGVMLYVQWQMALVVFAVLPPLAVACAILQRRLLHSSRAMRKVNSQITASYNESLQAVRTTKALAREAESLGEFTKQTDEMYGSSMRNALQSALYMPIVTAVGATGAGLALWYGGLRMMDTGMTLGDLVLFITCAGMFFDPVNEMARVLTEVYASQASVERVLTLLATEPAIRDSEEVKQASQRDAGVSPALTTPCDGSLANGQPVSPSSTVPAYGAHSAGETPAPRCDDRIDTIEFRDVDFAYKEGQPVLTGFNLTVSAGKTIALVGHTGGGKSTIVSLLCRFYEPTAGQVLINGVDYRRRSLLWLQSRLGIVLQTPHLFGGSVRENIRYGRLTASDDEVAAAARLVNAEEFILRLEHGYDTEVGQGGNRLSTGQKQLISFARAVLADPQIFVMDEATSSVDTHTERLIQRGVEQLLKGRTSFVIAHRLSTIRNADHILVIEHGRITEQGTHHDLLRLQGRYHELYTHQFVEEKKQQLLRV
ncbi:MAG: ABC transporter ATP-binding protein/permease [Phycisphaerae bacterium]|nr:ABC transporter ATP-binding protein/permease [Phycisphaerae bacterium]